MRLSFSVAVLAQYRALGPTTLEVGGGDAWRRVPDVEPLVGLTGAPTSPLRFRWALGPVVGAAPLAVEQHCRDQLRVESCAHLGVDRRVCGSPRARGSASPKTRTRGGPEQPARVRVGAHGGARFYAANARIGGVGEQKRFVGGQKRARAGRKGLVLDLHLNPS